jgi:hypothetical protein
MDRNRRDAGVGRGTRDADGDLAAIGDQKLFERHAAISMPANQTRGSAGSMILLLNFSRSRQGQGSPSR